MSVGDAKAVADGERAGVRQLQLSRDRLLRERASIGLRGLARVRLEWRLAFLLLWRDDSRPRWHPARERQPEPLRAAPDGSDVERPEGGAAPARRARAGED